MTVDKTAIISEDGTYRYLLTRYWDYLLPPVVWVMLNPSTADAEVDDRTIGRCTEFARAWGYGGIVVVNLYAYRATAPKDMLAAADPVGPENDWHLAHAFESALLIGGIVVCGWGNNAKADRAAEVHALAVTQHTQLYALRVTKTGQPQHPLYLPGDLTPEAWAPN